MSVAEDGKHGEGKATRRRYAPEALDETPHCVEWGEKADGEVEDYDWAYFTKLADARAYADSKSKDYPAVWLGELGDRPTGANTRTRTWYYYWWTKGTGYDDFKGRGWGAPASNTSEFVEYSPLDQTDWALKISD